METLTKFRSMVSTDKTWRDAATRRTSSNASLWVRMAASQPGLRGLISSTECDPQEQHSEKIPDFFACLGSDGIQRGRCLAQGQLLERTEECSAGGRREFVVSSLLVSWIAYLSWPSTEAVAADDTTTEVPLEVYSDAKDGFTLMRPAPWNKVDKPGASIFFEDPESRSNNIGVTVAPVRIASLDGFGTVEDIVKKLVKAERDKPSTKDIQVIEVLERKVRGNPLYALEYTLDTTRGSKRVLTSVTVANYKLYILNIIFADGPVAPASPGLYNALHQVLNSFELFA